MPANSNAPFNRGQTWFGIGGTVDSADAPKPGRDYWFDDIDYTVGSGAQAWRSNRQVRCRLVKNGSGIALLPKQAVVYGTTSGDRGLIVKGKVFLTAGDWAGIVDEFLPSAGVPDGDYFFIVVEGPSMCLMPLSQIGDIAIDDYIVAVTAATSQATTAGYVAEASYGGATSPLADPILNLIGRALSAASSSSTGGDLLVDIVAR